MTTAISTTQLLSTTTDDDDDDDDDDCSNLWSEIHEDMIHQIFERLTAPADCIRFGSVCVSWRSIQSPYLHPDLLDPQLPLLMIPTVPPTPPPPPPQKHQLTNSSSSKKPKPPEDIEETRSFYCVSEKYVYKNLHINLPYNRYCRGSSHGWIITSEKETGSSVELFNPFISVNNEYQKIQLPPLTAFLGVLNNAVSDNINYLYKAIVSVNPSLHPKDYVVMAIYGGMGRLCFWRPGDHVWTDVDFDWCSIALDDIIYHEGLFYAVNARGEVMVIDNDLDAGTSVRRLAPRQPLRKRDFKKYLPLLPDFFKNYLVESEGDLLLVNRGRSSLEDEFRVFKLINKEEAEVTGGGGASYASLEWKVMNTLPGRMLFVGDNASISLAASDFPGGKPSCIYFTDDEVSNWEYGYDGTGIFSMEENKLIEKLRPMGEYISSTNSIWVEPTLRCCFRL